jgi:hypothetical protein
MSKFDDQLPYAWSDLIECDVDQLTVGGTVVKLGFPCAYSADRSTGRMAGVFGLPTGSAWTITARRANEWTVQRADGQARQTVTLPPTFRIVTLAAELDG